MARVTLLAPDAATPEQQAAYADVTRHWGRAGNAFRAMGHCPELMRHVSAAGGTLRADSVLSRALREAVILAIAGRWGCAYIRAVHVSQAREQGLSDATIEALGAGELSGDLPPLDAAAVRYALALSRDGRADDALVDPIRAAAGERGLVELTLLTGWYSLLAMFLNGLEVEQDAR